MKKQLIHQLTWDQVSGDEAYLYGSHLSFTEAGVVFENQRMASGKMICRFESATHYQHKRTSPTLPLLTPGQDYWIEAAIETEPANRFFLEWTYLNRQGETIDVVILRKTEGLLSYPEEAFSYRLTLKSAGGGRMLFRSLSLYTLEDSLEDATPPISKAYPAHQLPDDLLLVQSLLGNRQEREDETNTIMA